MGRRTVLFSPGDRPEMLRKAPRTGADVVVFDLEDAVAPARKAEAREAVASVLGDLDAECEVCVRVNPVGIAADDDLKAVLDGGTPDSLMAPKVADADDVGTLASLADGRGAALPVLALIETAAGVLHAEEIAAADATDAVCFGAEDLAADLGATRTAEGTEVLYAREHVVTAAAAAGVDAVDTLYTDVRDTAGLREDAAFGRNLGYDGKLVVHPDQVPVVNEAFTPDEEDVEWAREVLSARDAADDDDRGVFTVDGEMIDAPLIRQAERIVARARAAGLTDE
ncbi:MAG: CoA ester lyase [Haloarculaceae archaeon]